MSEKSARKSRLKAIGPGIVIAATGLGAGDIVTAAVGGATYGPALLWAVIIGGILKFTLNEGLARWQLVTGKTLLEGWADHLHPFLSWYFLAYLILWSFIVGAALMAASGLAANALFPQISIASWGIIHSLMALAIVILGRYSVLESAMKFFIGLMFLAVLFCAIRLIPTLSQYSPSELMPGIPGGSLALILGIMGGVGGSVTVLSYGYWIREAGWKSSEDIPLMRLDLSIAYVLTVLFGLGIMLIAAGADPEVIRGNGMVLAVADQLEVILGSFGKWIFLVGFWGAIFSSMIGVWNGVPYLFADYIHRRFKPQMPNSKDSFELSQSKAYRGYLVYLAIPPMLLLFLDRPVWLVVAYSVAGAFFMPLLAAVLIYMNSQAKWLKDQVNSVKSLTALWLCLTLFGFLLVRQLLQHIGFL